MQLGDLNCFSDTDLDQVIGDMEVEYLKADVTDLSIEHFGISVQDDEWRLVREALDGERREVSVLETLVSNYWVVSGNGEGSFEFPSFASSFTRKPLPFHQDGIISGYTQYRLLQIPPSAGDVGRNEKTSFLPLTEYARIIKETFKLDWLNPFNWGLWYNSRKLCASLAKQNANTEVRELVASISNVLKQDDKNREKIWKEVEGSDLLIEAPLGASQYSAWDDFPTVHAVRKIGKVSSGKTIFIDKKC